MIQKRSSINLHWSHDIASIYLGPLHVDDCAWVYAGALPAGRYLASLRELNDDLLQILAVRRYQSFATLAEAKAAGEAWLMERLSAHQRLEVDKAQAAVTRCQPSDGLAEIRM
jgi:hypothetical protein